MIERCGSRLGQWAKGGAAATLALTLGGCDLVVLDPMGDVALQQRNLIYLSTALMLLIIVPVLAMTVLFAWRYRQGGPGAYDPDFDHSTGLELVIWSCPLLIIIVLGAVTWSSTHLLDPFRPLSRIDNGRAVARKGTPLEVQAVAMDWKWLFIYPEQGIATVNQLTLPVDRPIHFTITSTSQMNAFYVPTLAGMIYAMPGMRSTLHAVLDHPVESHGISANYTGAGFSDMRFRFHGLPAQGFARWADGVRRGGGALDTRVYKKLDRPSEKVPAMGFATVQAGLFDRILNRCVEPGRPCASDLMKHDTMIGMPPAHDAGPLPGGKPEPALSKSPHEKGGGENRTAPRPSAPGHTQPGDARNRTFS